MKKTNILLTMSTLCLFSTGLMVGEKPTTKQVVSTQKRKELKKETKPRQVFTIEKKLEQDKNITSISMKPGFYSINHSIYFFDELGMPHTGFINFEGNTYYLFDKDGLATNWNTIGDFTYYFDKDGKMVRGLQKIDHKEYYFNDSGQLQTGFISLNNKVFYFDQDGKKLGFLHIDEDTYYIDAEKGKLTSFQQINNQEYYFNNEGKMHIGFLNIDDKTYYFNEQGVRQTKWIEVNENTYYLDDTTLLTGIQPLDDATYYFNELGCKQTGLQKINDELYYFDENGKMKTGFLTLENQVYYFNEEGKSQYGFIHNQDQTYYLDSTQQLKTGLQEIDHHTYYFDNKGVLQTGFQKIDNQTKYFDKDGKMVTGNITLENKQYTFDTSGNLQKEETIGKTFYKPDGSVLATNAKKIIDVSKFQGNIDWNQVKNSDVDGVILRLGFGSYSIDSKFIDNLNELKRLNIPYGIYLYSYAVNSEEAKSEANFVLNSIKNYHLNPTLGIYYDIESNSITSHLTIFNYEQIIPTFLNMVRTSNFKTNVYTYKSLANEKLYSESLTKEITWIAQYSSLCTWHGFYEGWQYTSSGQIPGIQGNVDISIFGNFKR